MVVNEGSAGGENHTALSLPLLESFVHDTYRVFLTESEACTKPMQLKTLVVVFEVYWRATLSFRRWKTCYQPPRPTF